MESVAIQDEMVDISSLLPVLERNYQDERDIRSRLTRPRADGFRDPPIPTLFGMFITDIADVLISPQKGRHSNSEGQPLQLQPH